MISFFDSIEKLKEKLETLSKNDILYLADENTYEHCAKQLDIDENHIIIVKAGEASKSIENAQLIWKKLIELGAKRDAFLINIGGGMVTDLGGFVASLYKRGIKLIHIPTSVLSMADASIGGKNGIDFMGIKNGIGTYYNKAEIWINIDFLETLPMDEFIAGYAEIIKIASVYDFSFFHMLLKGNITEFEKTDVKNHINKATFQKLKVVKRDFTDKGYRQILNFGHTIGHALESMMLAQSKPELHGNCVAVGMLCELEIARQRGLVNEAFYNKFVNWILTNFPKLEFDFDEISFKQFLKHDKKIVTGYRIIIPKNAGEHLFLDDITLDEIISVINLYKNGV